MNNKLKKAFLPMLIFIILIHVGLIFLFGAQKEGYHEDEYYSFWSSAGYADLMPEGYYDWRTGPKMQEQFFVSPEDTFCFQEVIANQAEDVHPPLYYLCLNVIMSLMPGRFFKWFSIGLNTLFSIITLLAVTFFFYYLNEEEYKEAFALSAATMYAIAPSVISNVMLVRMYAMSGMWTVLYACILLMAVKHLDSNKKVFGMWTIVGAIICYLSFLTHYFSLLVPGLMTVCACVYVLFKKKYILRMVGYGFSLLVGIGLAVCTFPACIQHIFFGYRGIGVLSELNFNGFENRIRFFSKMLNDTVWGGCMYFFLVIVTLSVIVLAVLASKNWYHSNQEEKITWYWYAATLISCVIVCFVLMKVSLYVQDGSRYFYPVLALLIPLMGCVVLKALVFVMKQLPGNYTNRFKTIVFFVTFMVMLLPYVKSYMQDNVLFLFRDDAEKVAFAETYKEYPLILLCDRDNMYRTWYTSNQIWPFYNIFYTDYEHIMVDSFKEETIQSADKLVVYMDAPEEVVQKLVEINQNIDTYTLIRHDAFYYIYLLE